MWDQIGYLRCEVGQQKRDELYRKLNWDAFYKTGAECKRNMPSYYK